MGNSAGWLKQGKEWYRSSAALNQIIVSAFKGVNHALTGRVGNCSIGIGSCKIRAVKSKKKLNLKLLNKIR